MLRNFEYYDFWSTKRHGKAVAFNLGYKFPEGNTSSLPDACTHFTQETLPTRHDDSGSKVSFFTRCYSSFHHDK